MTHLPGHVKRNPDGSAVAIRTVFPEEEPFLGMTWLVATISIGAKNATTAEVESWDDIYEVTSE